MISEKTKTLLVESLDTTKILLHTLQSAHHSATEDNKQLLEILLRDLICDCADMENQISEIVNATK